MLDTDGSRIALLIFRILFALAVLMVCIVTLGPFQGDERLVGLNDKGAHAFAFYVFTLLFYLALPRLPKIHIGGISSLFGVAIEIAQAMTGRDAQFGDWLADTIGVVMALVPLVLARLYHRSVRGDWLRQLLKKG